MASIIKPALLFFLVFLFLLHEQCSGTPRWTRRVSRRWRVPPCPRTNCKVGLWTSWSTCTDECGNQGTQFRTRIKVIIERCKGTCPYHLRETRPCNRNACQNGGSPAAGYCVCSNGFNGTCCETVVNVTMPTPTITTTSKETTPASRSTPAPATVTPPQFASQCFKCLVPFPLKCKPTIQTCKSGSVCYVGRYTIKDSGRRVYASGCTRPSDCKVACVHAMQTGKVSKCSVQCCTKDLCNYRVLPTATTAPITPKNRQLLRVLFKLLASLRNMVDAISTLLKIHFNKDLAALHKREVIDLMSKVEHTIQQFDESRDPEVLKAKADVVQARMRAMEMLNQLDDYTNSNDED